MNTKSHRVYLDHASTSPLRPVALDAMLPYFTTDFADPGRVHTDALATRVGVEIAREQVAAFVDARPQEVVFTSGGTEAIAYAHAWARGHVVTSAVEHSSVRDSIDAATNNVTVVGVDRIGRVDPEEVAAAVRPDTVLISIQLANHEVGTIQSLAFDRPHGVLLHVDACAAIGNIAISFKELGADLMSITSHKLGGPKGAGALVIRRGVRIESLLRGGAQERGRRAGIENVPAIVGFGAALADLDIVNEGIDRLRFSERLASVTTAVEGVERFGSGQLPGLLCIGVAGVEAEPILLSLDQHGIAVHSGSACSSETLEASPVLEAMGVDAQHSLRMSAGWNTADADIDKFLEVFPTAVAKLRSLR